MELKWNYILDKQPENGTVIVQIDEPWTGSFDDADFKKDYPMGMRLYNHLGKWEDFMKWCDENNIKTSFWWIYAKDFPFPDKP